MSPLRSHGVRRPFRFADLLLMLLLALCSTWVSAEADAECGSLPEANGVFRVWPQALATSDKSFDDGLNRPRQLSEYKGRPVLLHFWGTWCPPCIKEMPALDRLQSRMLDDKLEIIAINRDPGGTDSTLNFYVKQGLRNLAMYTDRVGLFAHSMKVGKVPVTIYINAEGLEVGRIYGLVDWDSEATRQHIKGCLLKKPA